jgi:hypothetical protein
VTSMQPDSQIKPTDPAVEAELDPSCQSCSCVWGPDMGKLSGAVVIADPDEAATKLAH